MVVASLMRFTSCCEQHCLPCFAEPSQHDCSHTSDDVTLQIVRGSYLPIASTYSKGLKDLVDMTLRTDPKRRPTVNEVLKMPVLQERIAKFLSATVRSAFCMASPQNTM